MIDNFSESAGARSAGETRLFGAIEAGGTKFICGIGTGPEDLKTVQIPTGAPESTIPEAIRFFRNSGAPIRAVGIGSFGPVDLHKESPTFGYITSTPKAGWRDYDLAGAIARAMNVPVGFDTDVNAAALGEGRWGSAVGLTDHLDDYAVAPRLGNRAGVLGALVLAESAFGQSQSHLKNPGAAAPGHRHL